MVYVTSQPVHPLILEYYFQLLAGIPASHARARLTLLCAHDASPRSLTEKILERPRLIQRIRYGIPDPSRAFMTVFNSTPLERKLSVLLGIPLNGVDPALSAPRLEVGKPQDLPRGRRRDAGGLRGPALRGRHRRGARRPAAGEARDPPRGRQARRELLGRGQRALSLPGGRGAAIALRAALADLSFAVASETHERFLVKFTEMGGIVEEFLEYPESRVALGAAAHRPAGRGRAALDPRPDPRRPLEPGLPGLPVPGRRALPAPDPAGGAQGGRRARPPRRRQPIRRRLLRRVAPGRRARGLRPRDQPAHGRHDASLPRAAVPDGRQARSRVGRVPFSGRHCRSSIARPTT